MRRKFKKKKRIKFKILKYLLFLVLILFILTLSSKMNFSFSKPTLINHLLSNNNLMYKDNKFYNSFKELLNNPLNILKNELNITEKQQAEIKFIYNEVVSPKIYIYNSHQGETYSSEYLEEYNTIPNVLTASYILKDKLDNQNIETLVEENDIIKYMKEQGLNHAGSYKASRVFLNSIINQYPNMELYIDLHRDSTTHEISTTTINNKPCAKILFVIGLENPNYNQNLSIANKINEIIRKKYPSLTRGVLKKQGYGVNGIYNQDLKHNVILIEVGGYENNIEEINNTLELVAEAIGEYIYEKEKI